jgi:major type 1 subunit fimbrin (pilin)
MATLKQVMQHALSRLTKPGRLAHGAQTVGKASHWPYWYVLPALLLLFVLSPQAFAACKESPAADVTITLPAKLTVPRDTPVGTVLFTQYPGLPSPTGGVTGCPSGYYQLFRLNTALTPSTMANVFATSVPGIGVQIIDANSVYALPNMALALSGGPWGAGGGSMGMWDSWTLKFIVTGTVTTSGTIGFPSPLATSYITSSSTGLSSDAIVLNNLRIVGTTTIVTQSCTTPGVTVDLGKHKTSEFLGVGSTTASVNVNIALNACPAGMNSVQYRIDPVTSVINSAQSVVALDTSSSATGVGVQLLDSTGAVFPLSTYKTFSGYSKTTGGNLTIPMKGRYYQTSVKVNPGVANTQMTFTMLYQ